MDSPSEYTCLRTLWQHRLEQDAGKIFLAFARPPAPGAAPNAPLEFDRYTFADVDRLVRNTAFEYARFLPPRKRGQPQRIVAFTSETRLGYAVTEFALARLGHAVLLVSANNSAAAIADLMKKTQSDCILHSLKLAKVSHEARQLLAQEGCHTDMYEEIPVLGTDVEPGRNLNEAPETELTYEEERQSIYHLLHSSGSTSFPKPLAFSQRIMLSGYKFPWDADAILSTVPLCHAFGSSGVWRGIMWGKASYILPATVPLTLRNLVNALNGCKAGHFNAVPYTLKLFAASPEARETLAQTAKIVLCAGSSCPKEVGDTLVAAGVNLIDVYGATESSGFFRCARELDKKNSWSTHYIIPEAKPFVVMEEVDEDLYEPVIKPGWPRTLVTNRPDGSYAMGDLFKRDLEVEDGYIYVGRKDDTLVHLGGEKTNPVPMEGKIRESPWVSDAMVFGAGKTQTGALILLTEDAENSGKDPLQLVWPAVQAANAEAPSHSRLLPEMVRVLPASAKFVTVDKMSIVRARTVAKYQDLIDDVYKSFEEGDEASKVTLQDTLHARQVIRRIVCECIGSEKISDTQDVFDFGIDSITSERILAALRRTIALEDRKLSPLFVFENPTIAEMSASLLKGSRDCQDQSATMKELVSEYFSQIKLQDHPGDFVNECRAHAVVLTGATGALGAHLLHQLCQNKHVTAVYCLCRAQDDAGAHQRLIRSLANRGLPTLGTLPEHSKVLALASDLSKADFGLPATTFAKMQREVTSVIHCGWPVNFNMSLRSFETSIQGAVNLMNLCVDSCGAFLFCSSVSTMGRYPGQKIPEEVSEDPQVAMSMGYAQSKWIVENLCLRGLNKGVESVILRIGQMTADTMNGIWNDKEAVPLMVKGIELVHSLPDTSRQQVNWLPVDKAATMIVKLLEPQITLRTMAGVYHITSTVDTPWCTVYEGLRAAGLRFELLPPHEWLQKLQDAKTTIGNGGVANSNPVLKLLEHFGRQYGRSPQLGPASTDRPAAAPEQTARIFVQGQVKDESMTERDSLHHVWTQGLTEDWYHLEPISENDVVKMVHAWKSSGFLC